MVVTLYDSFLHLGEIGATTHLAKVLFFYSYMLNCCVICQTVLFEVKENRKDLGWLSPLLDIQRLIPVQICCICSQSAFSWAIATADCNRRKFIASTNRF